MAVKGKSHLAGREETERADETQALDPEKDFEEPVKKEPKLLEIEEQPVAPQFVQKKQMMAHFIKPHFGSDKDEKFMEMEFSMNLTPEHKGLIPEIVENAWKFIDDDGSGFVGDLDVPAQSVEIRLAPDDDIRWEEKGAVISQAALAVVEEKGTGEAEKVVRFKFRIQTDIKADTVKFATTKYAGPVWIKMKQQQGKLGL
jgi:hypothetical protein